MAFSLNNSSSSMRRWKRWRDGVTFPPAASLDHAKVAALKPMDWIGDVSVSMEGDFLATNRSSISVSLRNSPNRFTDTRATSSVIVRKHVYMQQLLTSQQPWKAVGKYEDLHPHQLEG